MTVDVTYSRPADAQGTVAIPFTLPGNQVVNVQVLDRVRTCRATSAPTYPPSPLNPITTSPAVAGEGRVTVASPEKSGCGRTLGTLRLTGLVAEDGTKFSPITVESRRHRVLLRVRGDTDLGPILLGSSLKVFTRMADPSPDQEFSERRFGDGTGE